jgi:hypothetical protein
VKRAAVAIVAGLLTIVLPLVVAGAVLGAPTGAFASTRTVLPHRLPPTWRSAGSLQAARRGAVLPGPYAISGTASDYDGTPLPDGAYAEWGWYDPTLPIWNSPGITYNMGAGGQIANGSFSFASVTSLPGSDSLTVVNGDAQPGELAVLSTWNNDFSTHGPYALRPGHVTVNIVGWPAGKTAKVTVGDAATGMAETKLAGSGSACAPETGFNCLEVRYRDSRGAVPAALDWTSPSHAVVPVTAGTTVADPVNLDWSQARRGNLAGPLCRHSGKPGSVVRFVLKGWPAGYQASFDGYSYLGEGVHYYATTVTSTGADQVYSVPLVVPNDTPAGDAYVVDAYRTDDPATLLDVNDLFQVCRFASSSSAIRLGGGVLLRGTVSPSSTVDVFMRHKQATQPWSLKATGWTRVAHLTSGTHGRFVTKVLHPTHTAWFVARYKSPYFTAFTSVIRVKVR